MVTRSSESSEKIWTRDFITIFIVSFVVSMGQFMMNTLIPKYAYQLGGGASVAGMVMGVQLVPRERRGAAGNTNYIGIDVGMLIGPTIAGYIITSVQKTTGDELVGFSTMYRIIVVPTIIAIVIFLLSRKKLLSSVYRK